MKNNKAFTFAEVMITLVVIGIVSLMVVPNLMDTSTSKFNDTAAKKAKHDVYQAALILQTKCPRHRVCADGKSVTYNLAQLLSDKGDTKYKFAGTQVIVNVDNDTKTDLHFTLNADGSVTDDNTCSVDTYKTTNGCTTSNLKTWSSAKDSTGEGAADFKCQSSINS